MKDTFLTDVVKQLIGSGKNIETLKLIVPSRRAVKFLKEALKKEIDRPIFAPIVVSIEDFVTELSGIEKVSPIELQLLFYHVYKKNTPQEERHSLYQFSKWAPSLLNEFSEIDSQLVEADRLFEFMSAVEQIEQWDPKDKGTLSSHFFKFQKRIPAYYKQLYTALLKQNNAYSGMQFREATKNLGNYLQATSAFHYFIGFNALTLAEETIIQEIIAEEKGTVLWDLDDSFFTDQTHSAGHFIRKYVKEWAYLRQNFTAHFSSHFSNKKQIEIINTGKNLAQAKAAVQRAVEIYKSHPEDTIALVLGDERILHPVLTAIASEAVPWNATMGYPLKELGPTQRLLRLIELLKSGENGSYPLTSVYGLREDPLLLELFEDSGVAFNKIIGRLEQRYENTLNPKKLIKESDIARLVFTPFDSATAFIARIVILLEKFLDLQKQKPNSNLECYAYAQLIAVFEKLKHLVDSNVDLSSLQDIEQVLFSLINQETLDFSGDPFQGIQIMGILETRILDFDHVLLTHVNEGILPMGKTASSWIPFDVRRKFGLNTFIEQDHLYAYHFFRLLQRSKSVSLFYNDNAEGLFSGERSRFLIQLEYFKLPNHQLQFKQLENKIEIQLSVPKEVEKTPAVLQRLDEIAEEGISPSALARYIRDPYQFYEQRLLKIKPETESALTINAADKGTLIHSVLEQLYQPYQEQIMEVSFYTKMRKELPLVLADKLTQLFHKSSNFTGKNHLLLKVSSKILENFIQTEQALVEKGNELKILGLEQQFKVPFLLPQSGKKIYLKGTVDRIDCHNGVYRFVDYKTGAISSSSLSFAAWEELIKEPKKGMLLQLLLYTFAFRKDFNDKPLMAGVLPLKNFNTTFLAANFKATGSSPFILDEIAFDSFENQLSQILNEVFGVSVPFRQNLNAE